MLVEEILVVSEDLHWLADLPQADNSASVSRCQSNLRLLDGMRYSLRVECRLKAYMNLDSL